MLKSRDKGRGGGSLRATSLVPRDRRAVRGGGPEEQPHVQGVMAVQVQEGREEPLHTQGQEGGGEETPLIQGKEQRLRFAGAAMKRYPTSKVRETQVRW